MPQLVACSTLGGISWSELISSALVAIMAIFVSMMKSMYSCGKQRKPTGSTAWWGNNGSVANCNGDMVQLNCYIRNETLEDEHSGDERSHSASNLTDDRAGIP